VPGIERTRHSPTRASAIASAHLLALGTLAYDIYTLRHASALPDNLVHLALEPVGFDEASLAAEAQAFEQPVDGEVAVVGLGVDAIDVVLLEQPRDHGAERLCRQAAALSGGREGDADLGGPRLIGRDAHGAVAA
jgi:hypothetical protein